MNKMNEANEASHLKSLSPMYPNDGGPSLSGPLDCGRKSISTYPDNNPYLCLISTLKTPGHIYSIYVSSTFKSGDEVLLMLLQPKWLLHLIEQHLTRLVPHVHRWRRFYIQESWLCGTYSIVFSSLQHLYAPSLIEMFLACSEGVNTIPFCERGINVLQGVLLFLPPLSSTDQSPSPFFAPHAMP